MPGDHVQEAYAEFIGDVVVLDIASPVVYIGTLKAADSFFLTLEDVDIHELRHGNTSKEIYVMEIARNQVMPNRKSIQIKQSEVLSLSRLQDVILY